MISHRHALATALYAAALACFVVGVVVRFNIASGYGAGLIFIASIALLLLAIKFDERL